MRNPPTFKVKVTALKSPDAPVWAERATAYYDTRIHAIDLEDPITGHHSYYNADWFDFEETRGPGLYDRKP